MCRMMGITNFEYRKHKAIIDRFFALARTGAVPPKNAPGHLDGWGIAWYQNGKPKVVKSGGSIITERERFYKTIQRIRVTPVLILHLRKSAWEGTSTARHAHPFSDGRHVFVHNGTITDYKKLIPAIVPRLRLLADSRDTEVMFHYIASQKPVAMSYEEKFIKAVKTIEKKNAYTSLSCLFSDGKVLYGYRRYSKLPQYYTLYQAVVGRSVIMSSEPLVKSCQRMKQGVVYEAAV